jgi:hypothetical protein
MAKITISNLRTYSIEPFIHNLTSELSETILGGFYTSGIGIMNITDSTYLYDSPRADRRFYAIGIKSFSSNENSYNSLDYGRTIYNG